MTANTTASVRAFADRRWLCLISAMVICVCAGFGYAWSVLQTPIIARFGWADSGVALAYTITVVCSTMAPLLFGGLIRRMSSRLCVAVGAVLFGAGLFAAGLMSQLWQLYLFYGVISGLGVGFIYPSMMAYVVRLFPDRSGMASGLGTAAYGSGAILWAPTAAALMEKVGLGSAFRVLGVLFAAVILLGSLLLAFPLGVATAVYLHEYAGNAPFARMVRLGVNNLAGVPSVVFGLFGLSFFVTFCGMGVSILSGVLTLAVLTLPVIISTAEESLRSVPDTYRQASLALGAGKAQTIARVVLPCAMPGMLTGAILGVARAAGETAAIMFTAAVFYTPKNPDSLFSSVMALPYHMYVLATAGTDIEKTRPLQYGTGLVLILLVLGMNLLAIILRDHLQRRHHA